jgi:hypothetical protein
MMMSRQFPRAVSCSSVGFMANDTRNRSQTRNREHEAENGGDGKLLSLSFVARVHFGTALTESRCKRRMGEWMKARSWLK